MKRWMRRGALGVLGLVCSGVVVVAAGGLFLSSEWGRGLVAQGGVGFVNARIAGEVGVGQVTTDYWSEVVLHDVTLDDGARVASASVIRVTRDGLGLSAVSLEGVELAVDVTDDGRVPGLTALSGELLSLLPPLEIPSFRAEGRAELLGRETVEELLVTGRLSVGSQLRLDDVVARGTVLDGAPVRATGSLFTNGREAGVDGQLSLLGSAGTVVGSLNAEGSTGTWRAEVSGEPLGLEVRIPAEGTWGGSWLATSGTVASPGVQAEITAALATGAWSVVADFDAWEAPVPTALPVRVTGQCELHGTDLAGAGPCGLAVQSGALEGRAQVVVDLTPSVVLASGRVGALGGDLEVEGRLEPDGLASQVSLSGNVPLSGVGITGDGWVRVVAEARGTVDRLGVTGTLSAASMGPFDGDVRGFVAPFSGTVTDGRAGVRADVSLERAHLLGVDVTDIVVPLQGDWNGATLSVNGPVQTGPVHTPDLRAARAMGPVSVRLGPARPFRMEVDVALDDARVHGLRTELQVHATTRGSNVQVEGVAVARATRATVQASADLQSGHAKILGGTVVPPENATPWVVLPGSLSVQGTGIGELDIALSRGLAHVKVGGDLRAARVELHQVPVSAVEPWLPGFPVVNGQVEGQGVVELGEELRVSGTFSGQDVGLDGVEVEVEVVDNTFEGQVLRDGPLLAFSGQLPTGPDAPVTALFTVDALDLSGVPELGLPMSPEVSASVRVGGTLASLTVEGEGTAGLQGLEVAWSLDRQGPRLNLSGEARASEELLAAFDASAAVPLDPYVRALLYGEPLPDAPVTDLRGTATLDGFPLRSMLALVGVDPDVEGTMHGRVSLTDNVPAGLLELRNGRIGQAEVQSASGRLEGGRLDAEVAFLTHPPAKRKGRRLEETGGFRVSGSVPVAVDLARPPETWFQPVHVELSGRGVPVAAASALHPTLLDGVGWLSLEGTVAGTPNAPAIEGRVALEGGALTFRRLGLRATEVGLQAEVHGDQLSLTALSARTRPSRQRRTMGRGPTIEATGRARIGWSGLHDVSASATLDHALVVARRDQKAWLSTTSPIEMAGYLPRKPAEASTLRVTGGLLVDRARVELDKPTLMEAELWPGPPRTVDPRFHLGGVAREAPSHTQAFWFPVAAELSVDLGVDASGTLELLYFEDLGALGAEASTLHMEGTLLGTLDVATESGKAFVDGQLDVASGSARAVDSVFTVNRGQVVFVDGDPYQPFVDVNAELDLGRGGDLHLHVEGTPSSATVDFSSTTLPADQVLTAVVTATHPSEVSGRDAMNVALGVVTRSLFNGFDLGAVEVRDGLWQFPLSLGPRLRLTPALGFGTGFSRDFALLRLRYIASSHLAVEGTWGNATRTVGFTWAKRY